MNVAIIPARGGSQRIPRKNIRLFHGKPIIAYSIEAAKASGLFEHVYVSTEDGEIADIGMRYGAPFIPRPHELADDDNVGTQRVAAHALEYLADLGVKPNYACCIYPCSPLLTAEDLRVAYTECCEQPYNYVFAEGVFYFGIALRFLTAPDDFSHSLQLTADRWIDINTESDWQRAERMFAKDIA